VVGTLIILFAAAGIASDNLLIAGLTGQGHRVTHSGNWILIVLFMFIIQNQVLWLGHLFGSFLVHDIKSIDQWLAIVLLAATGIKMLQELNQKNQTYNRFRFAKRYFMPMILATAIYVFVFGCAMGWLNNYESTKNVFLFCLLLSMISGFILGKYHRRKTLKSLSFIGSLLVLLSAVLFIIQKLIGGY
jgi:putative Mn2+ efflux pump MntP